MCVKVDYIGLGNRIRVLRKERKMTQEQLAEAINCGVTHISNIETARSHPSLEILIGIANTLNTSLDYLLCLELQNSSKALDKEVAAALAKCEKGQKEKILRIMPLL